MANQYRYKKIRGLKRRIRHIQKWKQQNFNVSLSNSNYDYVKIKISPWPRSLRFAKLSPPLWYRRLILSAMFEIYHNWKKQLLERGEPFYLKIWLFHPRFSHSQVVAGIGERIDWYQNIFPIPENQYEPFPYSEYASNHYNLHDVKWELRIDDFEHYEKMDELTPQEVEILQKTAYHITQTSDGDTLYAVWLGSVWVGDIQ
ncbi:MAG: hypothetical protein ACFCUV_08760 [Rivularia sp. (in: cyanobacteria)]